MKLPVVTTQSIFLILFSLATLSSCKKDKDEPVAITIQSLSGSYKLGAWTYKFNNDPEENMMLLLDDCEKDDVITLKTDKTYNSVDAGLQCIPPDGYDGDWDLPSTTKIILDGSEWTIDSYDGKVLKISQSYTSGGDTEIEKMTLNKQ